MFRNTSISQNKMLELNDGQIAGGWAPPYFHHWCHSFRGAGRQPV